MHSNAFLPSLFQLRLGYLQHTWTYCARILSRLTRASYIRNPGFHVTVGKTPEAIGTAAEEPAGSLLLSPQRLVEVVPPLLKNLTDHIEASSAERSRTGNNRISEVIET